MSRVLFVALIAVVALSTVTATQVDAESEAAATERLLLQTEEDIARMLAGVTGFKNPAPPKNKLPTAKSDSSQKNAGEKESKPAAAKAKDKNNSLGTKIQGFKSIAKGLTADVSIVSKEVFASLKAAKIGQNIKSIVDKISEFKNKVTNYFKSLVGMRFATAAPACHWVMSIDKTYSSASGWKTTPMQNSDHFSTWTPGTCSVGAKIDRLGSYNCFSGATQKSVALDASASASANFICVDKNNNMVSPPGKCKAKVQLYAGYKATTYSWSDSGWRCPIGSRYIQVSAAHEAMLQVNGNTPVNKGVVTTTGNSITETYSFTLTAGGSAAAKNTGPEVSANVGASFGRTVNEIRDFGEKTNLVAVQHQNQYDVPMTAILSSTASTQINGGGRVFGVAHSWTNGWMICLAATSMDCGMKNTGATFGVGEPGQLATYQQACTTMMRNNNIRV